MNYSLGNMLGGAGALNADKLSLDLQFAADKTLTARKGPTPTFTRASSATFVGSNGLIQSAAINAARFDHDPVTLACKGLLIEESRTNVLQRSGEFNQSPWTSTLATVTPDDGVSPDGLTTAESFLFTGVGSVIQTASMGSTAPTATFSFFVKAKTGAGFTRIIIGDGSPPTSFFGGWFNLSTGLWATTATGGGATLIGTSVTNLNNGWYRISITGSVSGISSYSPFLYITDSDNTTTRSLTVSQLWWGAQLEAGSFPTSYIPTVASSVVRSADVCSITGSDFTSFYNQSEGTIVGSGLTNQPTTNAGPLIFRTTDGTNNNIIQVGMTNSPTEAVRPIITASGTTTYNNKHGTATVGVERKVGTAYKTNDAISAFNGTLGTLDTTVTLPTNCNNASLFTGLGAGTISSFRYYKKRLSDQKLQALTTL